MHEQVVALGPGSDAARSVEQLGTKAANLARLAAAGLPVPPAHVLAAPLLEELLGQFPGPMPRPVSAAACVDDQVRAQLAHVRTHLRGAALPGTLRRALPRLLDELGPVVAVRSSSNHEDRGDAAAAGLFTSILGVTGTAALERAVREVWCSLFTPAVWAYALQHGRAPAQLRMAVIVQTQIRSDGAQPGAARGVLYTRSPHRPSLMLVEARRDLHASCPRWAELSRDTGALQRCEADFPLPEPVLRTLGALARRAETALDCAASGADVEWVHDGRQSWLVQARPIAATRSSHAPPEEIFATLPADASLHWVWDRGHNPEPLSPAQAGLVERIERSGIAPYRMQVVGGYLYTAARPQPVHTAPSGPVLDRFTGSIAPALEAALTPLESTPPAALDVALDAYQQVVALYTQQLTPLLARRREALLDFLRTIGGSEPGHRQDEAGQGVGPAGAVAPEALAAALIAAAPPSPFAARRLEQTLDRAARGAAGELDALQRMAAPLAAAWDVAAATVAEDEALLPSATAARRARLARHGAATRAPPPGASGARAAAPDAEQDAGVLPGAPPTVARAEGSQSEVHGEARDGGGSALATEEPPPAASARHTPAPETARPEASRSGAARPAGPAVPPPEPGATEPVWSAALDRLTGAALTPAQRAELAVLVSEARAARDIAEIDDHYFFRAQAGVRRALRAIAARWQLQSPELIFFLPLEEVVARAASGSRPDDLEALTRRALAARERWRTQRHWSMPLAVRRDATGRWWAEPPRATGRGLWRGRGVGGTARGRVRRVAGADGFPASEADTVLVALAVPPSIALSAGGAAALVCEHGGLLDHGAAMARELGIPCVVGCRGVWAALREGDEVWVDASAGVVVKLSQSTGPAHHPAGE